MKIPLLPAAPRVGIALVLCLMPGRAEQSLVFDSGLVINSLAVENTNLVFRIAVPPGMEQVVLEKCDALGSPWREAGSIGVASEGGEFAVSISRPAVTLQLFRLKAKPHLAPAAVVSSELQYVAMPSLATSSTDALFHFHGMVDGSDKILITRQGALWEHVAWQWPSPITVNGKQWDPRAKNYLTTVGTTEFLPEPFSLASAELEVIKGRDVVALERTNDALVVYINDTPVGPAMYDFTIRFHQPPPTVASPIVSVPARLKIAAQIDGSDCLKITAGEATWVHKTFRWPTAVSVNGMPWFPKETAVLKNEGTNAFLPAGVDFSTAKIVGRKGRDMATLWAEKDALWVRFADNPNGSDHYEVDISFGR